MKKIFFTAFLMLIAVLQIHAQSREKGAVEITPFIGFQFAFTDNTFLYTSYRSSLNYGVKVDYYFNDRWSLRTGLTVDKMGTKESDVFIFTSSKLHLDYVSVPLNANWHFGNSRNWNLNFGISPSFLINVDPEEFKDNIESFQLGFTYGIGYKLEISEKLSVLFDAQSYFGLGDVIAPLNNIQNETQRNFAGYYGLGLVYKL